MEVGIVDRQKRVGLQEPTRFVSIYRREVCPTGLQDTVLYHNSNTLRYIDYQMHTSFRYSPGGCIPRTSQKPLAATLICLCEDATVIDHLRRSQPRIS